MSIDQKITHVQKYFDRLTSGDTDGIIRMFDDTGIVVSPFLGQMSADEFFAKLSAASSASNLTVFDILLNQSGNSAAAYFQYDWTLASGDDVVFQGVDYFEFSDSGKFKSLRIFYDTHPLRETVGDKYENA